MVEALLDAHRFRDLVVDLPTQKPALLRQLLLPIVIDAIGLPADRAEWAAVFAAGRFTDEHRDRITNYLGSHRHLFDLFSPVEPFGQVADLHTAKNETKGAALLVATAATGNNVPLFSSRTEADPLELTPAQAAHWLLHTHCWDTASIKTGVVGDPQVKSGKTTGNPTGPLGQLGVVLPVGRTLFETLMLNLPAEGKPAPDDLPQWRRRDRAGEPWKTRSVATPAWQTRNPTGLLDLLTWQSRRIRLFPEQTTDGIRVSRVIVAAGDRLEQIPDIEPHTAWIIDPPSGAKKKAGGAARLPRPRRHQPGKAAWRGLEALLAIDWQDVEATKTRAGFRTSRLLDALRVRQHHMPDGYPLQVELTGISYGTQSAVIEDILHDSIPLPLTALDPYSLTFTSLLGVADQAERLANAVNNLSADLRRAAGAEPIPWDKGQRPGETLLHALDPLVRRLLAGLRQVGEDFDEAERGLLAWERAAARQTWLVAEQLIATAAPGVFAGRTITKDGKDRTYRLSSAETAFRSQLDTVLTRLATEHDNDAPGPEEAPSVPAPRHENPHVPIEG
ncbi:CRISPR system Cascade subunit CasA [Allostreptomyces psammosilenae]|uniref:CRISPR system Cascade subunit CasA n=1 Tax=Allostreptomyces psammosilenae TaxID=1892865 RepID=A0A852ZQA3_9ACTN|nr:CRISPR system Cascade subunit CasA [Allostreptomyces psammosilenae]